MPLSRATRRVLIVLIILAVLAVAGAAVLPRLLDVNQYRPLIADKVRQATGRTIKMGTITLRLLPSPALRVKGITVSEGPRYPDATAMKTESLSIRVALLPLLRGELAIRSIVLHAPALNLIRDERGRWNFDDLLARADGDAAPAGKKGGGTPLKVAVERAVVRSARLHIFDDAVAPGSRTKATIGPIDAVVKGWGADQETEIDLSLKMGGNRLNAGARILDPRGSPRLSARVEGQGLRAAELAALLPWLGIASPAGLDLGGEFDLDGSAEVPLDKPETLDFKGTVRLNGVRYSDASMTQPLERITGTLRVEGDRAEWREFGARIGGSSLQGKLQVQDFLRPRVGFQLSSPTLDLNEILAAFSGTPSAPAVQPGAGKPGGASAGLFDQVRARGSLNVDQLRFQTFDLTDVETSGGLENGVLALQDLKAGFYAGRLVGAASADLTGESPLYKVSAMLENVDLDPLLNAYDRSLQGLLRGRLTGNLDVQSSGLAMEQILSSAGGTGRLEVAGGTLASFSVLKYVAAFLELAGGKGVGRDETPFEYLRGTLAIGGGKARTRDLELHSADLDLSGSGWVGLDASLDLDVRARFSPEATAGMAAKNQRVGALTDAEGRMVVPFNLSGSLAGPKFRFDTGSQLRELREEGKEKLKQRALDRLRDRIQERTDRKREDAPPQEQPPPQEQQPPPVEEEAEPQP